MDTIIQPVTTRAKRGPYRQHSDEFKRDAVARTLIEGASVSLIARELKINTNQLFSWRKRFNAGATSGASATSQLVPVKLLDTSPQPTVSAGTGVMVLSVGKVQLRLEGQVDPGTLELLLARLLP